MSRYFIGFMAFLGLGILLIVLLFTGGSSKPAPSKPSLVSYANTDASVELLVNGPVQAPQNHYSLDISVNQNSINANLVQGYNGNIIKSKIYNNTESSFNSFLYALYYDGYTKGGTSKYPGTTGLCSTGDTYDFYLKQNGQTLQHYWQTSCGGGTYRGSLNPTILLFNKQVPDLSTLTVNSNL